ncbi:MAG: hypothetical protein GY780_08205 [bacterium]|nr:hypothetical protein [bacterium]
MTNLTRNEAHLLVAAIRILEYSLDRPPTPAEMADLLNTNESSIRLDLNTLAEMGIVLIVESAYEIHAEVKNYQLIDDLPEDSGPQISDDLAAFDLAKEEEARKMAQLFDSGEHEKNRQDRINKMDQELEEFKKEKPRNPFGDD